MDPLLLRFVERIVVVLIGGLTIYLGFRLFLKVPEQRDSAGKVVLPWSTSIVMTRIGPGVFFALFGVVAVGLSLLRPLEIAAKDSTTVSYASGFESVDRGIRADARALLRRDMAFLNGIPQSLRPDLANEDVDHINRGLRRVKLALIRPIWGDPDEGFGELAAFETWVEAGEPDPAPAGMTPALELYGYGAKGANP